MITAVSRTRLLLLMQQCAQFLSYNTAVVVSAIMRVRKSCRCQNRRLELATFRASCYKSTRATPSSFASIR